MARPALAFMGFPIGNALNLQGTVLAVEYALGPTEVAIFATARTVSRVALQMVQLVNQTFWPELSSAFGAGKIELVRRLHRRACQMAIIIGVGLIAGDDDVWAVVPGALDQAQGCRRVLGCCLC